MKELMEETIAIRSPAGSLEGVFGYDTGSAASQGVLLLSPHPCLGGDLENNVIAGAATVFAEGGFPVLRFNYHGVGRSEGGPDDPLERVRYWSELLDEDSIEAALSDTLAALDWLMSTCEEVHVFGYSYGAFLALRLAADRDEVRSVAAVGLAVANHDLRFLARVHVPVLAIHGDRDFATPVETVASVLEAVPSSSRFVELDGSDHFFRGQEYEVATIAQRFFEDPPERLDPGRGWRTVREGVAE